MVRKVSVEGTDEQEAVVDFMQNLVGKFCIMRGVKSGVFAGRIAAVKGRYCWIPSAVRIWYWEGAASLSQLATEGTSKPSACKFPIAAEEFITDVCEYLPCTSKAEVSILSVKPWKA